MSPNQEIKQTENNRDSCAYSNGGYVSDTDTEKNKMSGEKTRGNADPTKENSLDFLKKGVLPNTNDAFTENTAGVDKGEPFEFDDLLPHIGEFGLYQKILFLLMIPFAFFVAWVYFTQIFITIVPEHYWCKIPELANLTVEERYVQKILLNNVRIL